MLSYTTYMTDFWFFEGSCTNPFTNPSQIWQTRVHPWSTLICQILYLSVHFVALEKQPPNFTVYSTSSFCGGSAQRCSDTVERRCTTTNLSDDINRFLYSCALIAKWRSQNSSFESVTDKYKDKNAELFLFLGSMRNPSPSKLDMVIEEVCTFLASPKHVRIRIDTQFRR